MYSLIRVWIGLKLARMAIQESVVVRTTSATDRPSTPTLYWIPKNGIHSATSPNWKPGRPGQEADQQQERGDPRQQREDQGHRACRGRRAEADHERADQRQEDDDRQERNARDVHRQRPASSRYEPAITISPMAMPRA